MIFKKFNPIAKKAKFNSAHYWDTRYANGGNSGAGSYGRLAEFKASVLNQMIRQQDIKSVIELGFGDGNQLTMSNYPEYTGFDISPQAVALCRERFADDKTKRFFHMDMLGEARAELVLSLDVIFHLVEDEVYEHYMEQLVAATSRFLAIYSSNYHGKAEVEHVRHRKFTKWISRNAKELSLFQKIENPYPYNSFDAKNTSFSHFWIFQK